MLKAAMGGLFSQFFMEVLGQHLRSERWWWHLRSRWCVIIWNRLLPTWGQCWPVPAASCRKTKCWMFILVVLWIQFVWGHADLLVVLIVKQVCTNVCIYSTNPAVNAFLTAFNPTHYDTTSIFVDQSFANVKLKMLSIIKTKKKSICLSFNALIMSENFSYIWTHRFQINSAYLMHQ